MKLPELADRLGLPPRQVRHLIAEDLMPPASAKGRYADGFGEDHLRRGLELKAMLDAGMGVAAIKAKAALDEVTLLYADERIEVRLRSPDALRGLGPTALNSTARKVKAALVRHAEGD